MSPPMPNWPDTKIADLFKINHPTLLAPMPGPSTQDLPTPLWKAGGLGSFGSALSTPEQLRTVLGVIRQRTRKPLNLNFFTHQPPEPDAAREAKWKGRLAPYYTELGLDPMAPTPRSDRAPFTAET